MRLSVEAAFYQRARIVDMLVLDLLNVPSESDRGTFSVRYFYFIEMSSWSVDNSHEDVRSVDYEMQRPYAVVTSETMEKIRPTDCVLVYDSQKSSKGTEPELNGGRQRRKPVKPSSDRRKAFEDYLSKKQGLVIENIVSHGICAKRNVLFTFVSFRNRLATDRDT